MIREDDIIAVDENLKNGQKAESERENML